MLSIVKMDLDSAGMDDKYIKQEELFIEDSDEDTRVMSGLELIPIVYTTRLDDMAVLKNPLGIHPREVTEQIIQESKPMLYDYPSEKHYFHNSQSFSALKTNLDKIYKNTGDQNEEHIIPDIPNSEIDPVKLEVSDETNSECKFSELLKLCKPLSIALSRVNYNYSSSKQKNVNQTGPLRIEENDSVTIISSSEEEEPLILLNQEHNVLPKNPKTLATKKTVNKPVSAAAQPSKKPVKQPFLMFGNKLLLNGLMEFHDLYSNEYYLFLTDSEGIFIDYYKDTIENASKYEQIHKDTEVKLTFHNCCWVQREHYLQSMYPKVLTYTNYRFIRNQHKCPLGACTCCCRKKEEGPKSPKWPIFATNDGSKANPPPFLEEDMEIQALQDEIEESINSMNKTKQMNTEWLRTLLSKPNSKLSDSLIERALSYEKTLPKRTVNRSLVTINHNMEPKVLIFRNFTADFKEVYELDSRGELQSYLKLSCFSNTTRPDVKKLTLSHSAAKTVKDVCCWYKREQFIRELLHSQFLHPSAAKFMRSRHRCMVEACTCCCKSTYKKGVTLTDVKNPPRPRYSLPTTKKLVKVDAVTPKDIEVEFLPSVSNTGALKKKQSGRNLQEPVAYSSAASNICKIASVSTLPLVLPVSTVTPVLPATSNPLPPEQMKHIENELKDDDMSGEVNTLITSILDRFKDVRLTINSDGKVAAALNAPVNTLTTVELKVLANILSYAQGQVNLLGLNSGMSLSNVINMKKNEQNATDNLQNIKILPHPPRNPNFVPQPIQPTNKEATQDFFAKSSAIRSQGFNDSFASFLAQKCNPQDTQKTVTPVIQNVFSLKKEDIEEVKESTSTTLWYRKPGSQQTGSTDGIAKNQDNSLKINKRPLATATAQPKRLRVLSPSKLVTNAVNEAKEIVNTFCQPTPFFNVEVGRLIPVVPLGNSNFQVMMKPQVSSDVNVGTPGPASAAQAASGSERTLVVTPLTAAGTGSCEDVESKVTVPVTVSQPSTGASTTPLPEPEAKPNEAVSEDEEDYCILGM